MLNVKQGSCEYQFLSHWFDSTRNRTQSLPSRPTDPEADALTTQPSNRFFKISSPDMGGATVAVQVG